MKVYLFFLVKKSISTTTYPGVPADTIIWRNGVEQALYAFTPHKPFAKYFEKTRKKNLFHKRVIEIDKDEYETFVEEHELALLGYHSVKTKQIVDGEYGINILEIIMTQSESDYILFESDNKILEIFYDIFSHGLDNYVDWKLFNKKILFSLNDSLSMDVISDVVMHPIDEVTSFYEIDHLSIYIKIFGNTYSKKGGRYYDELTKKEKEERKNT